MILHRHYPRLHLSAPTLAADPWGGSHDAVTDRRKLPWRYRWADSVRDDVLARLLALNAERYAEEVAMGLHSKGAKQAARAGGGGKRRGRPPKASPPGETVASKVEQMGLGL